MHPAARVGDALICPVHGGGVVAPPGSPLVLIGGRPAARQGDGCNCATATSSILDGSPTVQIGGQAAARMTERCAHGGTIISGDPSVLIGNPAVGPDGKIVTIPPECAWLQKFGESGPGMATGEKLHRRRDRHEVKKTEIVKTGPPCNPDSQIEYIKRVIVVRGHEVAIYEPTTGVAPPAWIPSAEETARAVAALSDEQLADLKEIYVVPYENPERPSDVANANHETGTVQYFPRVSPHPQSDVDWAIQHESAHLVWADTTKHYPGFPDAWQRAIDRDHRSVSRYGDKNAGEDFADFMVLYATVLGTPCEGSARALFRERMALMDTLFPNGLPVRRPSGESKPY